MAMRIGKRAGLPDSRHENDSEGFRVCREELPVLREEKYLFSRESFAKLAIGHAAPIQRDHMIRVDSFRT